MGILNLRIDDYFNHHSSIQSPGSKSFFYLKNNFAFFVTVIFLGNNSIWSCVHKLST